MLLAIALATGLALNDLRHVRTDLTAARDVVRQAADDPVALTSPEGRTAVKARLNAALGSVASARREASQSLPLSAARFIPGLATQRKGIIQLVDDAAGITTLSREFLDKLDLLAERTQLRDGVIPVDGMRALGTEVRSMLARLEPLARSSAGLWGPVGDARQTFDRLTRQTVSRLSGGVDALDAALNFAGAAGDRRYLVAVQNNAEMRDQGAVLSYVTVQFAGGRLSFGEKGSVGKLPLDRPAPTPLPPGTEAVFGAIRPTEQWHAVNATADFPFSAQAMTDMYKQSTDQAVDGIIAIDVPGLAAILRVVGPVTVPGISEPVSADNAGRLLLNDLYAGLPPATAERSGQDERRERLGDVTEAVIDRVTTGTRDTVGLGRSLASAAKGGHLRLWSKSPEEEGVFERTGLGGRPGGVTADRTFHVAIENRIGSKVDYFVKPTVRMDVLLTTMETAVVRTTVTVDNQAPVGAAPSYQLGPDLYSKAPGDYLAWVLLWGPQGSTMPDGTAESGLNLAQHVVGASAGERREVSFDTVIPHAVRHGRLDLRLVPQPRLTPIQLEVRLSAPGWSVGGSSSFQGPWDQVLNLSWAVDR